MILFKVLIVFTTAPVASPGKTIFLEKTIAQVALDNHIRTLFGTVEIGLPLTRRYKLLPGFFT